MNAIQKRAWGEEWDTYFDPAAFVEHVLPAIGEALEAIDDGQKMASVLLRLYRGYGDRGTLARLLEASVLTGSGALYHAVDKTASQSGRVACVFFALLKERMAARDLEEEAVAYLFHGWRASVRAIRDPAERLGTLRDTCEEVLDMARDHDPAIAERLGALQFAGTGENEQGACEAVLEVLGEELAEATDPWPIIEALFCHQSWLSKRAPAQLRPILRSNLRAAIAAEGHKRLWNAHAYFRDEWKSDDLELALALRRIYVMAVMAVTDFRWRADRVLDICTEIASDDSSCWLPDRTQLARACVHSIAAVAGATIGNGVLVDGLARAVHDEEEAADILVAVTRALIASAVDPSQPLRALVAGLPVPSPCTAGAGLAG